MYNKEATDPIERPHKIQLLYLFVCYAQSTAASISFSSLTPSVTISPVDFPHAEKSKLSNEYPCFIANGIRW